MNQQRTMPPAPSLAACPDLGKWSVLLRRFVLGLILLSLVLSALPAGAATVRFHTVAGDITWQVPFDDNWLLADGRQY